MIDVLIKRGNWDTDILTQGENHVGMKAEIGLCFYKRRTPKIANKPPEARGEAGSRWVLTAPRRSNPADTSISDF